MRSFWVAIVAAALLLANLVSGADATPSLTIGFSADPALVAGTSSTRAPWITRALEVGAGIVRMNVNWAQVAPVKRPPGFQADNSASAGYNWRSVDGPVRELTANGLQVLMTILDAPTWAEGPHRPSSAAPGSWRPSANQLALFAEAAARRYSGRFRDPSDRATFLPRVRYWQAWNEPNLSIDLAPQWTRSGRGFKPASPAMYRQMEDDFYRVVKGVSSSNFVLLGGTAPFGDPPGGQRISPVTFYQSLFCLSPELLSIHCADPDIYFDGIDHHPYSIGGPLQPALDADDVSVPDMYKITRVLRAGERTGSVLPRGSKALWVTEMSWDSSPPNPNGVPVQQQARWYEQAMYVLWREGVDAVLWLQIVDDPPIPNYGTTSQGGLFYLDGSPKPSATAVSFPFVTSRINSSHVWVWGRAPTAGVLTVEVQLAGQWVVVRRLKVRTHQVFLTKLTLGGAAVLQAQVGGQTSLTWSQTA
jgi:hypothetical protein